ncbi:hypothetical protein CDD81_551 [Ophiocordyceps australis]|uniref:Uncharacterized protein n=1 Tax=Ophiocordyceps australis TaxID=1399860 RepID=A0A2C5YE97_9HYPO|nr:hypothetical protein CDD81_551 [Ophiocordyceps australis]
MRAHHGMLIHHWLAPLDARSHRRRIHLLNARVRRRQAMQALLKERTQPLIRLHGIHKNRIAARIRFIEDIQKGGARRLRLIRHIRVPSHGAGARAEIILVAPIALAAMHQMNLWMARRGARRGMDVVAAKVGAKGEGVGNGQVGKVLVAKGHDFALGDKEGQLVLAGGVEGRELDAVD